MRFLLCLACGGDRRRHGLDPRCGHGALLIGLAEQFGSVYFMPTYAVVLTFLIMVVVLAFRPQGLMGRA